MSEKIEAFSQNCTLVAVKAVLAGTKTDAEILVAFRNNNYKNNQGMYPRDWHKAARELGLELTGIKLPISEGKFVWRENWRGDLVERWVGAKYTLAKFIRDNPKGVFLVSTPGHALTIVDGAIHDPNMPRSTTRRTVRIANKVENSPLKSVSGARQVKWIAASCGVNTGVGQRRREANQYLTLNGPCHGKTLVANTSYRAGDLRWDHQKGNLMYV